MTHRLHAAQPSTADDAEHHTRRRGRQHRRGQPRRSRHSCDVLERGGDVRQDPAPRRGRRRQVLRAGPDGQGGTRPTPTALRVAVTAFANKQVFPLAERLGEELGADKVCLFVSEKRRPRGARRGPRRRAPSRRKSTRHPRRASRSCSGVSHKFGRLGEARAAARATSVPAPTATTPFDVLFVDEAWQLPLHLFTGVEALAPVAVGVGDVGQLPPIDPSQNPWRGDPGYNPYRAWPTAYEDDATTFVVDLPAVWRPTGEQLPLWRAFYGDWDCLNCVAAPGDRSIELPALTAPPPTSGQRSRPASPRCSRSPASRTRRPPTSTSRCSACVRSCSAAAGRRLRRRRASVRRVRRARSRRPRRLRRPDRRPARSSCWPPATRRSTTPPRWSSDWSRSSACPRASSRHRPSTPGRARPTGITVAIHPLSGADQLDDFNSAFGRLAVTCTRATHGLLMVSRAGLDELLADAPARPGTPFGEPGTRVPRQTHQRILASFARGVWDVQA